MAAVTSSFEVFTSHLCKCDIFAYLNFPSYFEFKFAHSQVISFDLIPSGGSYPNISPPTNIPLWKLGIFVDKDSQVHDKF